MTKKRKIILTLSSIAVFVLVIVGMKHIDNRNYKKTIQNPPMANVIESEMREVLCADRIIVYYAEQQERNMYYDLEANDLYFRVRYEMKGGAFLNYFWQYMNYAPIKAPRR